MIDEEEYVDIVDEHDKIIGKDTKENKLKKSLISRNVIIFVLDNDKNLLITKRSPHKKTYPNRYDVSAVGNIKAGEKPEAAAKRELKEELNIDSDVKFAGKVFNKFDHDGLILKYYSYIFLAKSSGEIILGKELTELQKIPLHKIQEIVSSKKENFVPSFLKEFEVVKELFK